LTYFSLLPSNDPNDGDYVVDHCHMNVWSLPGLFGHRPTLVDIGVLFEAVPGPNALKAMEMVIPARVVKQLDLSREVANTHNAQLIFGRHFRSATGSTLTLDGSGTINVVSVAQAKDESKLQRITDDADRELTGLRVELGPVPAGKAYIRVRFVVDGTAGMWRWNKVLFRRAGAIIDFRVHDPREGGHDHNSRARVQGRDKPIPRLDAFFMLSERFQLSAQNPELEYTRTLEGSRWRDYLRRSPGGFFRRERILVHRWKVHESGQAPGVRAENPFRGYLQFQRSPALRPISDTLVVAAATAVLVFALFRPLSLRTYTNDLVDAVGTVLQQQITSGVSALTALSLIGLVTFVLGLLAKLGRAPKAIRKCKRAFKRFEYWCLSRLGR